MPEVVIVGSGFAGLGMAIRLAESGRDDFVILEQADSLGGTWRDNTYPGCACDVQSHFYSFSFAPNPDWSRTFGTAGEIRAYLERVADDYRLRDRIRFGVQVTGAEYDEQRCRWEVRTATGEVIDCRFVVWGTGALHEPSIPEIDGLDAFRGRVFHSARWDHDLDLTGRRIAVIGTGASAIQFVPQIAARTAELTVVQRTPPWIIPKPDRPIKPALRRAFARLPLLAKLYRAALYARLETTVSAFLHPKLMQAAERMAKVKIRKEIADPGLRRAVTPDYTLGCKRVLLSNDYYPALNRPNVHLVTDPIERVTPRGVITADGAEHPVDTIIFGTGFKIADNLKQLDLVGRGGVKLVDAWRSGAQAYRGTTIADFPNLFVIVGPNTGLSHSSMIYMIESQVAHVLSALALLDRSGARAIEVRKDAQRAYNDDVQDRMAGTVWTGGGCASWYLDEHGVNRMLWPGYLYGFRRRTRRVDPADYKLTLATARRQWRPDRRAIIGG